MLAETLNICIEPSWGLVTLVGLWLLGKGIAWFDIYARQNGYRRVRGGGGPQQ